MNTRKTIKGALALIVVVALSGAAFAADAHMSSEFEGPKANTGTLTHAKKEGKNILTFSDDFVLPDTPDPHLQIVDSPDCE